MTSSNSSIEYYDQIIKSTPLLSKEEEKSLAISIIKDKSEYAKEKLFNANIRLVIKFATKVHATHKSIDLDDLISGGCIGLMKATMNFDPVNFDNRFSTYACNWIKMHINRIVSGYNKKINIPQHIIKHHKKYVKIREKCPDMPISDIQDLLEVSNSVFERIVNFDSECGSIISLQDCKFKDDEAANIDYIEDTNGTTAYQEVYRSEEMDIISDSMSVLNEQEKDIVNSRQISDQKETLASISHRMGVSKERIRQIEKKALDKMKLRINRKMVYGF